LRDVRALCVSIAIGLALTFAAVAPATSAPLAGTTGSASAGASARSRAARIFRRELASRSHHRTYRQRGWVPRARAAVVGGVLDSIEQVPWQVAVFADFEVEGEHFGLLCGGSIIAMSRIVTAAHCAINPFTEQPLPPSSFVVLAGASAITSQEIETGPTVEAQFVEGARIHPDFDYRAGPGTPDDVAVLQLKGALTASAAVKAIELPSPLASPVFEGTDAALSGFGAEDPSAEELDGDLHSLSVDLGPSRECGGEADAVFLCASSSNGSACGGDSGGALTEELDGSSTLIGLVDTVDGTAKEPCGHGALDGFVNLAAGEVRGFIEGSEDPPLAPRGGGIVIRGKLTVGEALSCEPGDWTNDPTYTYTFIDSANEQVLRQGSSSTYLLSEADVGRTIQCQLQAANAGGVGTAVTSALPPVKRAPSAPPPPPQNPSTPPLPQNPSTPPPSESGGSSGGAGSGPAAVQGSGGSEGGSSGTARGGVLSYAETHVGSAQIRSLLRHELTFAGASNKLAAVLAAGGFTVTFKAPEAGRAVIDWYRLPTGATPAGRQAAAKPLLVASAEATFSTAGKRKLEVTLTAVGRRLLEGASSLKLTAKAIFTPNGEAPVLATKTFVLRR
jgi:Trypsin